MKLKIHSLTDEYLNRLLVKCVKNLKGRAFQRGFEGFTLLANKTPRVLLLNTHTYNKACVTCVRDWDLDYKLTNMADDKGDCGKVTQKRRGRYREYMRYSNPYKFPAARRRKGNLYKLKQSSTGTRNDLNKCDVEELIPEQPQAHAASLHSWRCC